jgi:hypothetical protein
VGLKWGMNKEKLIQKFVENNIPINKWDKKELDQLEKLLKKEIKGPHEYIKFDTNLTAEWDHKGNLNFFLGGWINIDFKTEKENQSVWIVTEIGKPEPKHIEGTKLKKDDEVGAIEIDGGYMYEHTILFELLSNMKPKSKIKFLFQRFNKKSPTYNEEGFLTGKQCYCTLETQSFDDRIEMMKNKFKITDELNVEKKLKEWKGSLFV